MSQKAHSVRFAVFQDHCRESGPHLPPYQENKTAKGPTLFFFCFLSLIYLQFFPIYWYN